MASLAEFPNTQACRTVASSSVLSREKRGHLLTSTMAPAKLSLPSCGEAVRADRGEEGGNGEGRTRGGGGGEQGAESSLLTLRGRRRQEVVMITFRRKKNDGSSDRIQR